MSKSYVLPVFGDFQPSKFYDDYVKIKTQGDSVDKADLDMCFTKHMTLIGVVIYKILPSY